MNSGELDSSFFWALTRDARLLKPEGALGRVDATIKTHKAPGEVVPRCLHCYGAHPHSPLMRWISHVIKSTIADLRFTHIVRDSQHGRAVDWNSRTSRSEALQDRH